jgi:DNA polymerase
VKAHLDFETRSKVSLPEVGAWAYAMHPSTEITAMGYAIHDEPVCVLHRDEVLKPLPYGPLAPGWKNVVISAHNAHFEYAIYNLILHRRYGWPALWEPEKWSCTMARAAVCGLPLSLDELGKVLDAKTPKDLEGRRIMLQLSKPLRVDPFTGEAEYDEDPAKYQRLYSYNRDDVRLEVEVDAMLPELSPFERRVWELDLEMNRRGVALDLELARAGSRIAGEIVGGLDTRLHAMTCSLPAATCSPKTCDGVDKSTRIDALKKFLKRRHGVEVESLDKESVTTLLASPATPQGAREVLHLRRQAGKKNSVAKYAAALAVACPDGRARGQIQYSGAHTRRWAGRLLQPQNFPKGFKEKDQAAAVREIKSGAIAERGDAAMDALSDSLRALFVAGPGKTLLCADYNAIEARVLFWLAGEEGPLAGYRRGESPYLDMARSIYRDPSIGKATHPVEYDIGKRVVLGCGYNMGWEKFLASVYTETAKGGKGLRLEEDLAQRAVKTYREKYAKIPQLWKDAERQAINAVKTPGNIYNWAGARCAFGMTKDRRFLALRLPSGEFLRYWKPQVRIGKTPWGEEREQLTYEGDDPDTHQWGRVSTYGGKLVENAVQATARDILACGMLNAKAKGYTPVLTVHDEVVAEVPVDVTGGWDEGDSLAEFIDALCEAPAWAKDCPLAAEGWVGPRYHK